VPKRQPYGVTIREPGGSPYLGGERVAVQDPALMRRPGRLADLQSHVDDLERVRPHTALDQLAERLALQQLHAQEQLAIRGLVAVVDTDDVAVVEQRERLRLADEPLTAIGAKLQRLAEHLDGDRSIQIEVVPAPHGSHAALADLVEHLDPAGEESTRLHLGHEVRRVAVLVEQEMIHVVVVAFVALVALVVVALVVVVVGLVAPALGIRDWVGFLGGVVGPARHATRTTATPV
jgi:hypothetical protein